MELGKLADEIAERHVARSLEELRDPEKVAQWGSGERAKQQAEEIKSAILAEAHRALELKGKQDADQKT